ncbi:unnamed protein product [Musa acuminata subsp. burmannicoides]
MVTHNALLFSGFACNPRSVTCSLPHAHAHAHAPWFLIPGLSAYYSKWREGRKRGRQSWRVSRCPLKICGGGDERNSLLRFPSAPVLPCPNNYGLLCYLRACLRTPSLPSLQARGRYHCGAEESCGKMGSLRFFALVFVAGAAVAFFSSSNRVAIAAGYASTVPAKGGGVTAIITNKKLKDDSFDISAMRNGRDLAGANVEDYFPFDTVPSSKAAIKS